MAVSKAFRTEFQKNNRTYYLTKANTSKEIPFPAMENRDGKLIGSNGFPMVIGDEVTAAGFSEDDALVAYEDMSDQLKALVLVVGDNRGHTVRASKTASERIEEAKAERNSENAFLREKGYKWEKKQLYFHGPGEFDDVWVLRAPDGELVIDAEVAISGEESIQTGTTVKALLTALGYYGQEAIDEAKADAEARAKRREMRAKVDAYFADDSNQTGETFENAESLFTVRPIQIEKHYPRRQFRIEADCIWREAWNSSDGDDWRFNNSDYGIAVQFKFDGEIAECLKALSK